MAKAKSRRGESADHLLNFQYRAPPEHTVSPTLGATRSQQRGHANQRSQPFDAEKAKQAYRIQTFQYVLYPDAALCACEGTTATIASQLSAAGDRRGGAATDVPASSSPPQVRGGSGGIVTNSSPNNAWATVANAPPALTASTRRAAVSATPQLGKTIAKSMIGFDSLVPWEYVYALVLRHSLSGNDNEFQCPICLEVPCAPRISPCGHVFCLPCILRFLDTQKSEQHQRTCPMCNELLVPKLLKRVLWCPSAPHDSHREEPQEEEFVLVHRDRDSSIILSHDDVHLIEGQRLQREMLSACGSGTSDLPPLVLPRAEDDASWRHSRYCIATEELHNLHQILDISALEERRMELQQSMVHPMPRDDAKELDSIDESMTLVNRYELMYFGTGGAAATPTTALACSYSNESVRDDATHRPAAATSSSTSQPPQPMSYDLYMSVDGAQRFLHFVCLKMLKDDREARGLPLPSRIRVRVLDVETTTQTDQTRSVLKPLAHIPLFGSFQTCFADMSPLVSKHTLRAFQEVVDRRMQRIREQQRLNEERSRHVSSVDDAWERHKEARRNADPIWKNRADVSPTMQAFAMPLEDLPTLDMLPPSSGSKHSVSSSSTAERSGVSRGAGGPSDSSVETRQRATKGRLEELHDALTTGNLAAVGAAPDVVVSSSLADADAAAVSQGGSSCWGGSTAASKLFAQAKGAVVPVRPTWGGSPFVDRSTATGSWPQPKAQEIDEDELMDDYVDPLDDLFQPRGGGGRYGGLANATGVAGGKGKKGSRRGGNTVSLAGTGIGNNNGGGKKLKGGAPQAAAASVPQQQCNT